MSLGWFKRVALWRRQRQQDVLLRALLELRSCDPLNLQLPIKMARLWRLVGPEVFTRIPLDVQISLPLERRHERLDEIETILDHVIQLIDMDDYEHFTRLLSGSFAHIHRSPLSMYLSTEEDTAIDVDAVYTRINSLLYTLVDVLDTHETTEYNRGTYLLYQELLSVLEQLIELELA